MIDIPRHRWLHHSTTSFPLQGGFRAFAHVDTLLVIDCNTKQILAFPDNASDINPLISSIISVLVLHVSEFNTGRVEILRCRLCRVVSPRLPRLLCELTWEMPTVSNKDLSTLPDKSLLLQQRAGDSSQLMESCLQVSFSCLQTATEFHISTGFCVADLIANML